MQKDPTFGVLHFGALTEGAFLEAFEKAGFYGIGILTRDATPWRVVEGLNSVHNGFVRSRGIRQAGKREDPANDYCCVTPTLRITRNCEDLIDRLPEVLNPPIIGSPQSCAKMASNFSEADRTLQVNVGRKCNQALQALSCRCSALRTR